MRCDSRRIGQIKDGDTVVGNRTKVTVVKNKVAPPFRKVEFDILYNQGISREGDLLDLGMAHGYVLKSGTWFSLKHPSEGEIRLGQGRERARTFLKDIVDLADQLLDSVGQPEGGSRPLGEGRAVQREQSEAREALAHAPGPRAAAAAPDL